MAHDAPLSPDGGIVVAVSAAGTWHDGPLCGACRRPEGTCKAAPCGMRSGALHPRNFDSFVGRGRETRQGPAVAQPVAELPARKCPRCADGSHEGACAQPFKRSRLPLNPLALALLATLSTTTETRHG